MKIYLIRHGQTTGDIEDRFGGDYDDDLTEEGQRQAEELADKITDFEIQKIFYSPLKRATQTAQILHQKLGLDIEMIKDLKERNAYGILTGMVKSEAREKYADQVELLKDPHNTVEGGEDYKSFKKRILETIEGLSNLKFKTIAIITHGGPIHCFFRELMGGEIRNIQDCAVIELETAGDGRYQLINITGAEF